MDICKITKASIVVDMILRSSRTNTMGGVVGRESVCCRNNCVSTCLPQSGARLRSHHMDILDDTVEFLNRNQNSELLCSLQHACVLTCLQSDETACRPVDPPAVGAAAAPLPRLPPLTLPPIALTPRGPRGTKTRAAGQATTEPENIARPQAIF